MKILVQTVYEDVDPAWMQTYLEGLKTGGMDKNLVAQLDLTGFAGFSSKDPTSNVNATTTYTILRLEREMYPRPDPA